MRFPLSIFLVSALVLISCTEGSTNAPSPTDTQTDSEGVHGVTIVEPFQVIWLANGHLTSPDPGYGGFAEASFATNGKNGKFVCSIRAHLPEIEDGTYRALLLTESSISKDMIKIGELRKQGDDKNTYALTYEENFGLNAALDNPHRYSMHLRAVVTRMPDDTDVLTGDFKVIKSVGWDELYSTKTYQ